MKTVYIDVYFLINFCVDAMSLALALKYMKINTSFARIIISATVGALYAVLGVLLSELEMLMLPIGFVIFFVMIINVTMKMRFVRRAKFTVAFLVLQILIGGFVYFSYTFLDRVLGEGEIITGEVGNRRLLIWSLIVLLCYGVVKVLIGVFRTNDSEKVVRLCVGFSGREISFDALVDTGNLAIDPTSGDPVVLLSRDIAENIIGFPIRDSKEFLNNDEIKRKIRVVPIKRGSEAEILYGFIADYVTAVKSGDYENISVTLAIDNKEDSYGGYQALLPAAAIDNVF